MNEFLLLLLMLLMLELPPRLMILFQCIWMLLSLFVRAKLGDEPPRGRRLLPFSLLVSASVSLLMIKLKTPLYLATTRLCTCWLQMLCSSILYRLAEHILVHNV